MHTCKVVEGIRIGVGWELCPSDVGAGGHQHTQHITVASGCIWQHHLNYPVEDRTRSGEIR